MQDLKDLYCSVFYLEETMILDIIVAIAISSRSGGDPTWLLIIGGPSSGKSELVNTLGKVPFIHQVSSMTENTFLSNMRLSNGQEASLLHRIGPKGMIIMKDYTSILAMRQEKRDIIISQMREIYDGHLTKEAGNGKSEKWAGKINWIGAVTESIYIHEDESSGMGRRTINYVMPLQDRRETTVRAMHNNTDIEEKRIMIQEAFAEYINDRVAELAGKLPELPDDFSEEIIDLSDFVTLVRTPVERNYQGELTLVPAPEMPMRVFQMLNMLAKTLVAENGGVVIDNIRTIIRRLAFDSIPKQRRLTMNLLAKYDSITSKGTAHELRYPTETIRKWLENVNVLGICERVASISGGPDTWVLNEKYREIMDKYGNIKRENKALDDPKDGYEEKREYIQPGWGASKYRIGAEQPGISDDPGERKELQRIANEQAEDLWGIASN